MIPQKIKENISLILHELNASFLFNCQQNIKDALQNLENEIRHLKLNLRRTEINSTNALVKRYFIDLPNGDKCICNGFIANNSDTLKDFAGKEGWHYFRRDIMA